MPFKISLNDTKLIQKKYNIKNVKITDLKFGIQEEAEHIETIAKYAPESKYLDVVVHIVMDHLEEDVNYYSKLKLLKK